LFQILSGSSGEVATACKSDPITAYRRCTACKKRLLSASLCRRGGSAAQRPRTTSAVRHRSSPAAQREQHGRGDYDQAPQFGALRWRRKRAGIDGAHNDGHGAAERRGSSDAAVTRRARRSGAIGSCSVWRTGTRFLPTAGCANRVRGRAAAVRRVALASERDRRR
jgi:hypothetical protein